MSLSSNSITSLRHLLFLLEHCAKNQPSPSFRIEEVSKAEVLLAKIGQLGVDRFQDDEYSALKPGLKMLHPLSELYGSEPKPVKRETIDGFFRGIVPFTRTLEVVLARAERGSSAVASGVDIDIDIDSRVTTRRRLNNISQTLAPPPGFDAASSSSRFGRPRTCYLIIAMFTSFVGLSCFLGVYFTVETKYGYSMGDAFTLAGWVVAIGAFVSSGVLARHYPRCKCWERLEGGDEDRVELQGLFERDE